MLYDYRPQVPRPDDWLEFFVAILVIIVIAAWFILAIASTLFLLSMDWNGSLKWICVAVVWLIAAGIPALIAADEF